MADLVNMKIDPKEREKRYKESTLVEGPAYPWGLGLNLDDEVMEKLGMATLPQVGGEVMVLAKATVTSASERAEVGPDGKTKTCQSVSLQITDLALDKVSESKDASESLYGK